MISDLSIFFYGHEVLMHSYMYIEVIQHHDSEAHHLVHIDTV